MATVPGHPALRDIYKISGARIVYHAKIDASVSFTIKCLRFSPNNAHLAGIPDRDMPRIWDLKSWGHNFRTLYANADVKTLDFSPNGTQVLGGCADGSLMLWDLTQAELLGQNFVGHAGPVKLAKFSPGGTWALSGASGEEALRVWDLRRDPPTCAVLADSVAEVVDANFNPAGTQIMAAYSDSSIRFWDAPKDA